MQLAMQYYSNAKHQHATAMQTYNIATGTVCTDSAYCTQGTCSDYYGHVTSYYIRKCHRSATHRSTKIIIIMSALLGFCDFIGQYCSCMLPCMLDELLVYLSGAVSLGCAIHVKLSTMQNYQWQQPCLPFKLSVTAAMFTIQIISDSNHVYHSNYQWQQPCLPFKLSVTATVFTIQIISDSSHVYHSNYQWQQPCLPLVTAAKFTTQIKSTNMLISQWCWSSRLQGPQHTVCITMHMTATTHMHANRQGNKLQFCVPVREQKI